jgi:hypothetical protein
MQLSGYRNSSHKALQPDGLELHPNSARRKAANAERRGLNTWHEAGVQAVLTGEECSSLCVGGPSGLACRAGLVRAATQSGRIFVICLLSRGQRRSPIDPDPGGSGHAEAVAAIAGSSSCAVFIGPHDLGAWESLEVGVVLHRAAADPPSVRSLCSFPGSSRSSLERCLRSCARGHGSISGRGSTVPGHCRT